MLGVPGRDTRKRMLSDADETCRLRLTIMSHYCDGARTPVANMDNRGFHVEL